MGAAYGVVLMSFLFVLGVSPVLIRVLHGLKWTQPIRRELSADHQAKRGTPLMAGLILTAGAVWPWLAYSSERMTLLFMSFLLFSAVGFVDDYRKAAFQDPAGISSRTKLLLQFAAAGALLLMLAGSVGMDTELAATRSLRLDAGPVLYTMLALLFAVGTANAVNYTDGLDGLLIVVSIPTYFFFFAVTEQAEVKLFSLAMIGCLLGLLVYNAYPAKAFMGDTGSLAIGGSLAFLAIVEKVEALIPLLFFVYFAIQLSSVLQIWYYKRTKLRLFRMAPIHYHFQLQYGWSENKIVLVFGLVSWICALLGIACRKVFF